MENTQSENTRVRMKNLRSGELNGERYVTYQRADINKVIDLIDKAANGKTMKEFYGKIRHP